MKKLEKIAMVAWVTIALAAMAFAAGQNLPAGEGKEIIEKNCTSCHDATPIVEKKATKEVWTEVVKSMQSYGLSINDADFAKVVNYLATHFGTAPAQGGGTASKADEFALPAGEGRELVAVQCTTCHDLEGVKTKKLTAVEWKEVVNNMVAYGAALKDTEVTQISDYLAKAFPK
jgi:mono/diheme cytochrome c family protein